MTQLERFFKGNKQVEEGNAYYPVSKSFVDENGKPMEWEFKRISPEKNEELRAEFSDKELIDKRRGLYRNTFDQKGYMKKLLVESIVFPDLLNADLQDSYGVKTPEELLPKMVDLLGEYDDLALFVQELNGFKINYEPENDEIKDKVDELKN